MTKGLLMGDLKPCAANERHRRAEPLHSYSIVVERHPTRRGNRVRRKPVVSSRQSVAGEESWEQNEFHLSTALYRLVRKFKTSYALIAVGDAFTVTCGVFSLWFVIEIYPAALLTVLGARIGRIVENGIDVVQKHGPDQNGVLVF